MRFVVAVVSLVVCFGLSAQTASREARAGVERTWYIAADEVDWDYMPGGRDGMMGMTPHGYAKYFSAPGRDAIGHVYRKAIYREYTDGTFAHLKSRPRSEAYLGTVGPVIHAEVGDTIHIVFRNHGTHPYSIHAHGVFYDKHSEGSGYADGVPDRVSKGTAVAPGGTHVYTYRVTPRAGPGPNDPSSIVWLYHSHVDERRDVNAGLIGPIVITRAGMATPDGRPRDVDREFVGLFMIYDENESWFLASNVERFVKDRSKKFSMLSNAPFDPSGGFDPLVGQGFATSNFRSTINGYQFADGPMMTMKLGERVRWYLLGLGEGINFHTPHWHGNTVLIGGQRTDVALLGPASMVTADMVPDDPGTWMFHCHVSEHMVGGMSAMYQVLP